MFLGPWEALLHTIVAAPDSCIYVMSRDEEWGYMEADNVYEIITRLTKKQTKFRMVDQKRSKHNIKKRSYSGLYCGRVCHSSDLD